MAGSLAACGVSDDLEAEPEPPIVRLAPDATTLPDVEPPLPKGTTCASDADCTGGKKCLPVGGGQKACVASKSCAGGAGADTTCGGAPNDDKSAGTGDC